jgi:hypothetical protein
VVKRHAHERWSVSRALEGSLARRRGDLDAPIRGDALEPGHTVDVDQDSRNGQAHIHERHETLAAGQDLRLVAMLAERRDDLVDGLGGDVPERGGLHATSSLRVQQRGL